MSNVAHVCRDAALSRGGQTVCLVQLGAEGQVQALLDEESRLIGTIKLRQDGGVAEAWLPPAWHGADHFLTVRSPVRLECACEDQPAPLAFGSVPFVQSRTDSDCTLAALRMAAVHLGLNWQWAARTAPKDGLTGQELLEVIGEDLPELAPRLLNFEIDDLVARRTKDDGLSPDDVIYRYIESGIPVIVTLHEGAKRWQTRARNASGHAVLVIGHGYLAHQLWESHLPRRGPLKDWWPASSWAHSFVVHDSAASPYVAVPSLRVAEHAFWAVALVPGTYGLASDLYEYEAEAISRLTSQQSPYLASMEEKVPALAEDVRNNRLVARTLVVGKAEWHKSFLIAQVEFDADELQDLPDWLVLVEVSTPGLHKLGVHYMQFVFDPRVSPQNDGALLFSWTPFRFWIKGESRELLQDYPEYAFSRPSFLMEFGE